MKSGPDAHRSSEGDPRCVGSNESDPRRDPIGFRRPAWLNRCRPTSAAHPDTFGRAKVALVASDRTKVALVAPDRTKVAPAAPDRTKVALVAMDRTTPRGAEPSSPNERGTSRHLRSNESHPRCVGSNQRAARSRLRTHPGVEAAAPPRGRISTCRASAELMTLAERAQRTNEDSSPRRTRAATEADSFLPFSMYSAPRALRQGPGYAAQSLT